MTPKMKSIGVADAIMSTIWKHHHGISECMALGNSETNLECLAVVAVKEWRGATQFRPVLAGDM